MKLINVYTNERFHANILAERTENGANRRKSANEFPTFPLGQKSRMRPWWKWETTSNNISGEKYNFGLRLAPGQPKPTLADKWLMTTYVTLLTRSIVQPVYANSTGETPCISGSNFDCCLLQVAHFMLYQSVNDMYTNFWLTVLVFAPLTQTAPPLTHVTQC